MGSTITPPPRASFRSPDSPYVFVSVADIRQSNVPNAVISTLGLGSCLGITCYDPVARVGGLLHAMLPDSQRHRAKDPMPGMYLDIGVPQLVESVIQIGGDLRRLEFKVFGGAQILQSNDYFSIGRQNVETMRAMATRHHLQVRHWEVGGQVNRSIELHLRTGKVFLRMPNRPEVWI